MQPLRTWRQLQLRWAVDGRSCKLSLIKYFSTVCNIRWTSSPQNYRGGRVGNYELSWGDDRNDPSVKMAYLTLRSVGVGFYRTVYSTCNINSDVLFWCRNKITYQHNTGNSMKRWRLRSIKNAINYTYHQLSLEGGCEDSNTRRGNTIVNDIRMFVCKGIIMMLKVALDDVYAWKLS